MNLDTGAGKSKLQMNVIFPASARLSVCGAAQPDRHEKATAAVEPTALLPRRYCDAVNIYPGKPTLPSILWLEAAGRPWWRAGCWCRPRLAGETLTGIASQWWRAGRLPHHQSGSAALAAGLAQPTQLHCRAATRGDSPPPQPGGTRPVLTAAAPGYQPHLQLPLLRNCSDRPHAGRVNSQT